MAHKIGDEFVRYIDIVTEPRDLMTDGGIDPMSSMAPRTPERINGISLALYDHQRLALQPMITLGDKGIIKCLLPPFRCVSKGITDLFDDTPRKMGIFETDALFLHLPVGSGKTLIILALVANSRVPKKRQIIVGVDFAHAYLFSTPSEMAEFPRHDATKFSLIGDAPWFFSNEGPVFPSVTPKIVERIPVLDADIIPTNLFIVGPHLLGQMRGYCETQVTYPWLIIDDLKGLSAFLVDACISIDETFGKYHLIILPAKTFSRSDTLMIETISNRRKKELNTQQRDSASIGRIQKMLAMLLARQRTIPTTDFLVAFCGAFTNTKVFARMIFDDYDTLHLQSAGKPPALNYIFVSGTSMVQPGNQFGFPSRPSTQLYARRAMSIAVDPNQVVAHIGLAPPDEQAVLCIEGVAKRLFIHLCKVSAAYIGCYRDLTCQRFKLDPFANLPEQYRRTASPLETVIKQIQAALNNDSISTVFELLLVLHRCGAEVGFPILPEQYVVERNAKIFTFGALGAILYRKIYSERMRTNIALLSLESLERTLREQKMPYETRYAIAATKNFVTSFAYPPCTIPFKEVTSVAMEPQFALSHIVMGKLPSGKQVDDGVIRSIWEFVQPKPGVMQLPQYLEFISPYIVYAIWAGKNFGNIAIDSESLLKSIMASKDVLIGISSTIANIMASPQVQEALVSKCIACNKIPRIPILITCCSTICCYDCLARVMISAFDGICCSICKRRPEPTECFALPLYAEEVVTLSSIAATFQNIQAVKEASDACDTPHSRLVELSKLNQFYFPLCGAIVGPSLPKGSATAGFPSTYKAVTLDKLESLKVAVERLLEHRLKPLRVLLYHNYADVNASIIEVLKPYNVTVRTFTPTDTKLYRTSPEHIVIIANDLPQICGFNMEYLDAVVFYSPPENKEEKTQIVCRGQRLGRDIKHKLIVLTLFYQRELANAKYQIPTVNDLPLWKNNAPNARIPTNSSPPKSPGIGKPVFPDQSSNFDDSAPQPIAPQPIAQQSTVTDVPQESLDLDDATNEEYDHEEVPPCMDGPLKPAEPGLQAIQTLPTSPVIHPEESVHWESIPPVDATQIASAGIASGVASTLAGAERLSSVTSNIASPIPPSMAPTGTGSTQKRTIIKRRKPKPVDGASTK